MRRDAITPLLITYNEEANLERVLDRLSWARRIVVVDSHSTDRTLEILATCRAVDVYGRPFRSFADQCNFGLTKIETEWVLSLDADYVLTDAFVDELQALDPRADGYSARFTYCVHGKRLRGSLYPPRTVLFRRAAGRYVEDGHAHRLHIDGRVEQLDARILHDDRKPLATWLDAQRRYAAQEADKLLGGKARTEGCSGEPDLGELPAKVRHSGNQPTGELGFVDRLRTRKWLVPILTPLYCLLIKGLILDGPAGWLYSLQRTYAEILLSLHLSDRTGRAADGAAADCAAADPPAFPVRHDGVPPQRPEIPRDVPTPSPFSTRAA